MSDSDTPSLPEHASEDIAFQEQLRRCRNRFVRLARKPLKEDDAVKYFNSDVIELVNSRDKRMISHLTSVFRDEMDRQSSLVTQLQNECAAAQSSSRNLQKQLVTAQKKAMRQEAQTKSLQVEYLREHIGRLTLQGLNRSNVMENAQRLALYILQGLGVEQSCEDDSETVEMDEKEVEESKSVKFWPRGVRVSTIGERDKLEEEEAKRRKEAKKAKDAANAAQGQNEATKLRMELFNARKELDNFENENAQLRKECSDLHQRLQKIAMKRGQQGDDEEDNFENIDMSLSRKESVSQRRISSENISIAAENEQNKKRSPEIKPNAQLMQKLNELRQSNGDLRDQVERLQMQIQVLKTEQKANESSNKITKDDETNDSREEENTENHFSKKPSTIIAVARSAGVFMRHIRKRRIRLKKRRARKRLKGISDRVKLGVALGVQATVANQAAEKARMAEAAAKEAERLLREAEEEKLRAAAEAEKAKREAEREEEIATKLRKAEEKAAEATRLLDAAKKEKAEAAADAKVMAQRALEAKAKVEASAAATKAAALFQSATIKARAEKEAVEMYDKAKEAAEKARSEAAKALEDARNAAKGVKDAKNAVVAAHSNDTNTDIAETEAETENESRDITAAAARAAEEATEEYHTLFLDPSTMEVTNQDGILVNEDDYEPGPYQDDLSVEVVAMRNFSTQTDGDGNDEVIEQLKTQLEEERKQSVLKANKVEMERKQVKALEAMREFSNDYQEENTLRREMGIVEDTDFELAGFTGEETSEQIVIQNESPVHEEIVKKKTKTLPTPTPRENTARGGGMRAARVTRNDQPKSKYQHSHDRSLVGELHQSTSGWTSSGPGVQFHTIPDGIKQTGFTAHAQVQRKAAKRDGDLILKALCKGTHALTLAVQNIATVRWMGLCLKLHPQAIAGPKQRNPRVLETIFQGVVRRMTSLLAKRRRIKRQIVKCCESILQASKESNAFGVEEKPHLIRKGGGYVASQNGDETMVIPSTKVIQPCCSVVDLGTVPPSMKMMKNTNDWFAEFDDEKKTEEKVKVDIESMDREVKRRVRPGTAPPLRMSQSKSVRSSNYAKAKAKDDKYALALGISTGQKEPKKLLRRQRPKTAVLRSSKRRTEDGVQGEQSFPTKSVAFGTLGEESGKKSPVKQSEVRLAIGRKKRVNVDLPSANGKKKVRVRPATAGVTRSTAPSSTNSLFAVRERPQSAVRSTRQRPQSAVRSTRQRPQSAAVRSTRQRPQSAAVRRTVSSTRSSSKKKRPMSASVRVISSVKRKQRQKYARVLSRPASAIAARNRTPEERRADVERAEYEATLGISLSGTKAGVRQKSKMNSQPVKEVVIHNLVDLGGTSWNM